MPTHTTETKRARAELRVRRREEAQLTREANAEARRVDRQKVALLKAYQKECAALDRQFARYTRGVDARQNRIHDRILILEGRE